MHLRIILLVWIGTGWATSAFGQLRQILYTTIPADSILNIRIVMDDDVQVKPWHNSSVFIETEVVLATCQEGIFDHVVAKGRYAVMSTSQPPQLVIRQGVPKRAPLTSPKGPCDETIIHRIYVPDDFRELDGKQWSRPENLNRSTINN